MKRIPGPVAVDTVFISHNPWDHTGGFAGFLHIHPAPVFIPGNSSTPDSLTGACHGCGRNPRSRFFLKSDVVSFHVLPSNKMVADTKEKSGLRQCVNHPEREIPYSNQGLRSRLIIVLEGLNRFVLKKCISSESFLSINVFIF